MKTLFLIFLLAQLTCFAQQNVKADLTLTQKATTVSTDLFQFSFYDNAKLSDNTVGCGYYIDFKFLSKSMAEEVNLKKLFYNGAECKCIVTLWDKSYKCSCVIVEIKQVDEWFFVKAEGIGKIS